MKDNRQIALSLAKVIPVLIWYIISVIQWSATPTSTPGIMIPALVKGVEAISVYIVVSLLLITFYKLNEKIGLVVLRILVIMGMYAFSLMANLISLLVRRIIGFSSPIIDSYFFIQSLQLFFPILLTFVVYGLINNRLDLQEEREKKLIAEGLAQQAKWMMLRYQVNPHFLFNALNTIRALIGKDDEQARKIVTELSEYFRYSLSFEKKTVVPITEEIDAVRHYLEIQKIRYREKLNFKISCNDRLLNCLIPVFTIQILAENGIKYGFLSSDVPIDINIEVMSDDGKLIIQVSNTGKIVDKNYPRVKEEGTKTGLRNLKDRLEFLDPDYSFSLNEEDEKVYAKVILKIIAERNEQLESLNN